MLDALIVGGGPAGCTAAIYGIRTGLKLLLVEQLSIGGQMALTDHIDNYPGIHATEGFRLAQTMQEQLQQLDAAIQYATVQRIERFQRGFHVYTETQCYDTEALILAVGAKEKKLNIPGEDRLLYKGVSYCALCDGMRHRGKTVAVIGGGNTAVHDAIMLSQLGCTPNTAWISFPSILDEHGYILADESCRTAIPGLYAIGDVRTKAVRQIVTACGDGAAVVSSLESDRAKRKGTR